MALPGVVSSPGERSRHRGCPLRPRVATKKLISRRHENVIHDGRGDSRYTLCSLCIKEMLCAAKFNAMPRYANLILGARRPGALISVPFRALFRITWTSLLLEAVSPVFRRRRGCGGLLLRSPSWCWSPLLSVTAPAAAPAAWRSRKRPPVISLDSAMCWPATRKFSALCTLTHG